MLIINHDHIHDYPRHYHYPSSIILLKIPHLVVLVGKAEPLVEGDGAVPVLVDGLEHVSRASLHAQQSNEILEKYKRLIAKTKRQPHACHQSKPNFLGRAAAAEIIPPNSSWDTWWINLFVRFRMFVQLLGEG